MKMEKDYPDLSYDFIPWMEEAEDQEQRELCPTV